MSRLHVFLRFHFQPCNPAALTFLRPGIPKPHSTLIKIKQPSKKSHKNMNLFKNSRSLLSRLLHKSTTSPPPPPLYSFRAHYYSYPPRPEVIHFRRRGGGRWYHDPRKLTAIVLISGSAAAAVYFGNLETVPYTNRRHLVLISPELERKLGEAQFDELKKQLAPKVLPPLHPDSIRVRLISSDIISAVHRGLANRAAAVAGDASYGDISTDLGIKHQDEASGVMLLLESPRKNADNAAAAAQRDEELLDDRWVHESRKRGKARGAQPETRHLDGLNWEVIVVRDKLVNAMCLPGGKIVVFTGLLDHFQTDPEIATVIAHEVGHAIARHSAEMITKNLWFLILQIVALQFIYMPDLINAMSTLLLRLPFSRRMEMEADHIGLLLLAAAGYDPCVAPMVYEKLGKITGDSALNNYLSTHPSSKKRAQLLRQAKVMEEALQVYREAIAGRGAEGFLWE